jgi:hypothetical protein
MFPTDPCYPVAQAIACPPALEVRRRFSLSQRLTQFRQGDILELTDSLSRTPKLLAHFFEGLRFATLQLEPLEDILRSRSSRTSSKARWSVEKTPCILQQLLRAPA